MALPPPSNLNPRARADRALEFAKGGFDGEIWSDTLRGIEEVVTLIAAGRIDFASPARTWEYFRLSVEAVVRKQREEGQFKNEIRYMGLRPQLRPVNLAEVFRLPPASFQGVSPIDIGRIAAIVVEAYAPDLAEVVPKDLRTKLPEFNVEVGFDVDTLRKVVREELESVRPSSTIEFRPGGGINLSRLGIPESSAEEAPEPAPTPEPPVTPAEERKAIETPPAVALPTDVTFPTVEQVRSYGRPELTAAFKIWAALFKDRGVRPAGLVYDAARSRFEKVFGFAAPEIFPTVPGAGLNLQRTAPSAVEQVKKAPLVREYVEERTHTGPEGEHREVVRGVETEPVAAAPEVPAGFYAAEATQLLTEKYRPRTLDQVLGNPNIINRLKVKVKSTSPLPATVIFTGPPGTGKTSTAQAWAHDYFAYKFAQRNAEYLLNERGFPDGGYAEVNAAKMKDDPTGFLTNRVLPLIRSQGFFGGSIKKFLVFDDVANLSPENQKLLLRPLEQFGKSVTVIWISNDPMKQLPALESRAAGETYKFGSISSADVEKGLRRVAEGEGWTFANPRAFELVAIAAQGDLRTGIGLLNARWEEQQAGNA